MALVNPSAYGLRSIRITYCQMSGQQRICCYLPKTMRASSNILAMTILTVDWTGPVFLQIAMATPLIYSKQATIWNSQAHFRRNKRVTIRVRTLCCCWYSWSCWATAANNSTSLRSVTWNSSIAMSCGWRVKPPCPIEFMFWSISSAIRISNDCLPALNC